MRTADMKKGDYFVGDYVGVNHQRGLYYGLDKTNRTQYTVSATLDNIAPGNQAVILKKMGSLQKTLPGGWVCQRWSDAVEVTHTNKETPRPVMDVVPHRADPEPERPIKKVAVMEPTTESKNLLDALEKLTVTVNSMDMADMQMEIDRLDKEVFSIYHEIETARLDAARICRLYKRLKDALVRRRQVKNTVALLLAVRGNTVGTLTKKDFLDKLRLTSRMAWSKAYDREGEDEISLPDCV